MFFQEKHNTKQTIKKKLKKLVPRVMISWMAP